MEAFKYLVKFRKCCYLYIYANEELTKGLSSLHPYVPSMSNQFGMVPLAVEVLHTNIGNEA